MSYGLEEFLLGMVSGLALAVAAWGVHVVRRSRASFGRCSGCDGWIARPWSPTIKACVIREIVPELNIDLTRTYHPKCVPAHEQDRFDFDHMETNRWQPFPPTS